MRALTTTQQQMYAVGHNATYARVLIDNGSGTYTDLTNLAGYNFVQQVSWQDSVDANGATGTINISRDIFLLSASPLMTQSKLNYGNALLFAGRKVFVYTATLPIDIPPQTSDWQLMWEAHVDTVDFASDPIVLTCSDFIMAMLVNSFIISQLTYGAPTGVALESVIQGLVNDNLNTPNGWASGTANFIQLYTPTPSTFAITPFTQQKQTMTDALNALAQQIGWNCRPLWDNITLQFLLTLYAPPRTLATGSVYTFGPDDYDDITTLQIAKTGIRNYIQGTYTDATTQLRQTLAISDAASQAKFGPPIMNMEISEAATSQINSAVEMTAMLTSALADLKDPVAAQTATMPYFYALDIGDILTWKANGKHYDTDLTGGIISYVHTIGGGESTTQVAIKGIPSGGYTRWFKMEARAGVAPSANVRDPAAPSAMTVSSNIGSLTINYTVPDITNWSTTEVYLSTTALPAQTQVNGKNQRPPSTYFAASARSMHLVVNNLTPGTQYYVYICIIDRDGNVGTMSTQVLSTAATVGPYQENLSGQQNQLIRNPDFDIYSLGNSSPPDAWIPTNFTWAARFANTAAQASGATCLQFLSTDMVGGSIVITSATVPFGEKDLISVGGFIGSTVAGNTASLTVVYLTAAGAVVGTSVYAISLVTGYLSYCSGVYATPVGTRLVAVKVTLAAAAGAINLDRIYANSGLANSYANSSNYNSGLTINFQVSYTSGSLVGVPGNQIDSVTGITINALGGPSGSRTISGTTTALNNSESYTTNISGLYAFSATMTLANNSTTTAYQVTLILQINTGSGFSPAASNTVTLPASGQGQVSLQAAAISMAAGAQYRWDLSGGGSAGILVQYGLQTAVQTSRADK